MNEYESIFDAVTGDKEESNELHTRADLMIVIRNIVQEKGWKQDLTAEILNLTQPRVSELIIGKIEGFRFKPIYKNHRVIVTVEAAQE